MRLKLICAKAHNKLINSYYSNRMVIDAMGGLMLMGLVLYVVVGCVSLLQISEGADIKYMPFWHGPWRWLLSSITR